MNKNTYCVYKHTNRYNNKIYIGITGQPTSRRWKDGFGYSSHKDFFRDIVLYGWINFDHEILYENLSYTVAKLIEGSLIKELDLMNPEKGYNLIASSTKPNNPLDKCLRYKDKKPILQIDPTEDTILKEYVSIKEALRELKIEGFYGATIFQSLKNPLKLSFGYRWKYKEG